MSRNDFWGNDQLFNAVEGGKSQYDTIVRVMLFSQCWHKGRKPNKVKVRGQWTAQTAVSSATTWAVVPNINKVQDSKARHIFVVLFVPSLRLGIKHNEVQKRDEGPLA